MLIRPTGRPARILLVLCVLALAAGGSWLVRQPDLSANLDRLGDSAGLAPSVAEGGIARPGVGAASGLGAGGSATSAGACGDPATLISAIQGRGAVSPRVGATVVVEAIVVGDYQHTRASKPARPELGGFFVQQADADTDHDPATSEGLFVAAPVGLLEVDEGDRVRVAGTVEEQHGLTRIGRVTALRRCGTGLTVTPAIITLPVPATISRDDFFEQYEGMRVSFSTPLTVTEHYELARYGQLTLSQGGRLWQYGQVGPPPLSQAGHDRVQADQARRSILLDDFSPEQNADPVFHPQPGGFSVTNPLRVGATVERLEGVLDFAFGQWRVQPTKQQPVQFVAAPRPPAPVLRGHLVVGAFNVLNYFNGTGENVGDGGFPTARGANSAAELQRQTAKIVAAISAMDPHVLGLVEIENDGDGPASALATLVAALNRAAGAATWDHVRAGASGGSDQIQVALIYQPAVVSPIGPAQVLRSAAFTNPNRRGRQANRPAVAQTFRVTGAGRPDTGEAFTAVVLHLKSKGSQCGPGDDSAYQGHCNETRAKAVAVLVDWLANDPTDTLRHLGRRDDDILVMGDLNSYYHETPMQVLYRSGYTNLLPAETYSFVYGGASGALDHALASPSLAAQVTDSRIWHINADESSLLDYNDTVLDPGEQHFHVKPATLPLYRPDPFRSSDHDPVLIGLDLSAPGD